MEQSVNRFIKGIVSDLNPIDIDNQSWVFPTVNVRITKVGDMVVAKPLDGNSELFTIPEGYKVIGAKEHADVLYMVLYKDEFNIVQVGSYPHVEENGEEFIYEYGPLKFVKYSDMGVIGGDWLFGDRLNYDGSRVDLEFFNSYDGTVNIYLNDTKNPTYVINNCFDKSGNYVDRGVLLDTLPRSILLSNSSDSPLVFDNVSVVRGGNLRPGNYQLFSRYVSESYDATTFDSQSDIISVASGSGDRRFGKFKTKNSLESKTTNSLKINLSNLDTKFKYYQIGYVLFTGDPGDEAIYETYLINKYYSTEEDTEIYINGYEKLSDISADEIAAILSVDILCKAQTIYNGRYIGANWENDSRNLEGLAALAKHAKTTPITKEINETNKFDATFMQNEFYPFGVVFVFTDGKESEVYPLNSGKTSAEEYPHGLVYIYDNNAGYDTHFGVEIDIVSLKYNLENRDDIIGFYIVRGARFKNQIGAGVVLPTADGIRMKGKDKYFYNKQSSAVEGYSIPNTFFRNYYPTQDTAGNDKAGYLYHRLLISESARQKLAFFSPETIFDDQSNLGYIDGDEMFIQILNDSIFEKKLDGNNNRNVYKAIEQSDDEFSYDEAKIAANMYFVLKGNKTNNGQFSAFIPDNFKDEGAVSQEESTTGWRYALRSSLFNNYIGLQINNSSTVNDFYIGALLNGFDFSVDNNNFDFTDADWSYVNPYAKSNGGSYSRITSSLLALSSNASQVSNEYYILKVDVAALSSGALDVIVKISDRSQLREEKIGTITESGTYPFVFNLQTTFVKAKPGQLDDEYYPETLEYVVLESRDCICDVSSIAIHDVTTDSAGELYSVFNFDAKLARIFKFENDDKYEEYVLSNFQLRTQFYHKVSQFIPKETNLNSIEIYNGDVYTGEFYMRGHKWFGARQLYAYGGSDETQIYQHGSYMKFKVKTDINIHARSLQPVVTEQAGQGNYSFLPYELNRENDWTVISSLEKDMHESTKLNAGFSQNESVKQYVGYDNISPERSSKFPARLRNSDKSIPGSFFNSFKIFRTEEYQDYDEQYGPIVSIHNLRGQLMIIQNDAISAVYTKENSSGEFDIALGSTDKYFYEKTYIKARYGARSRDHVYETDNYIYGIDVANEKFWRIGTGSSPEGKQLTQVEDLTLTRKVNKYLILFLEAVKDYTSEIHIGHDAKNNEILFTFKHTNPNITEESTDPTYDDEETESIMGPQGTYRTTIVFSERINAFTGLYKMPSHFYTEFNNKMISVFDSQVYVHDDKGDQLTIFGVEYSMILSYIVNSAGEKASPLVKKFFQAVSLRSPNAKLKSIKFKTDAQQGELTPFYDEDRFWLQPEYNEYNWEIPVPLNNLEGDIFGEESQLKGEWLKVTLEYEGKEEFYVVYATALFNPINY